MHQIDLRRIDLNLLVVFDVLMTERSVTRAASRLRRTQSAISHALQRLREQVDDPLLIKVGLRMQPSPFAERLAEQIRPILASIAHALAPPAPFDPITTTRHFRIAIPDLSDALYSTGLAVTASVSAHSQLKVEVLDVYKSLAPEPFRKNDLTLLVGLVFKR